jgi:hypothetical protein
MLKESWIPWMIFGIVAVIAVTGIILVRVEERQSRMAIPALMVCEHHHIAAEKLASGEFVLIRAKCCPHRLGFACREDPTAHRLLIRASALERD